MNTQSAINNLDISSTMKSQITAECKQAEAATNAERVYEVKKVTLKHRHDVLDFNNELARINAFMQL